MTTLDDLFIKPEKVNGALYSNGPINLALPADVPKMPDKVTIIGMANPTISFDLSDKEFYKRMYKIDPVAAKQFMESRLKALKENVTAIREEIKQLEEYMEPSEDKIVSQYYKKVRNSDEPGSLKSHIIIYFKDNIKKDVKPDHILASFRAKGLKIGSKASIGQVLYGMVKKKEITNPYRGYFRMDA